MLSEVIKEHIQAPRNMGILEAADGTAEVVGPVCGDQINLYLKVSRGRISEVRFTTHGCWVAVAMGSYLTELAKKMTLPEALALDGEVLAKEVAGLPEDKWPCAVLAVRALHQAIADYQGRQAGQSEPQQNHGV
jgi:nitrogen fixation protein NifU and related proteins